MPYLTPDVPPVGEYFCRVLRVPATPAFLSLVDGAISELGYAYNFEQFGVLTPDETAELFVKMFVDSLNEECASMTAIDVAYGVHEVGQNTVGGAITLNTDTPIPFNTIQGNPTYITSLGGNIFTVVAGLYQVHMQHFARPSVNASLTCWAITSDNPAIKQGTSTVLAAGTRFVVSCDFRWQITAPETCEFFMRANNTQDTSFFGIPANIAGHDELYGVVSFLRVGDAV